jgi:hypothetical protein
MSEANPCRVCGTAGPSLYICDTCGANLNDALGEEAELIAVRELSRAFAAVSPRVKDRAGRATGVFAALDNGVAARTNATFRGQEQIVQNSWTPATAAGRKELIKQCIAWRPAPGPQFDMYQHQRAGLRAAVDQRIRSIFAAWEIDEPASEERARLLALVTATQAQIPPVAAPSVHAPATGSSPATPDAPEAPTRLEKPPGSLGWLFFASLWFYIPGIIYYKAHTWTRTQHIVMVVVFVIFMVCGGMFSEARSRNCPIGTTWNGWRCEAY